VLPETGTGAYEAWWRVGVAEVSDNPRVRAAHEAMRHRVGEARRW